MSSVTFSQKPFKAVPPEKGSFPLDHTGICKNLMKKYMNCLTAHEFKNTECRKEAKDYLECRMEHSLMTKEPWSNLGMKEFEATEEKKQTVNTTDS